MSQSPASSVPWPAVFVECDSSSPSGSQRSTPHPRKILPGAKKAHALGYGSEASSSESDEEEGVHPLIPRVYRGMMETPMDAEPESKPAASTDLTQFMSSTADPLLPFATAPSAAQVAPMAETYEPRSLFDFHWKPFPSAPIPPESRRERFSQSNVGPKAPCVDPYDIFISIWDRQIMENIASETNRYAQQVAAQLLANNDLRPNSRIKSWRDTTADELYVYLAMLLAIGVVVKSRLEDYWSSTPDIFYTPGFGAHMSFNRFLLLSKCLHFNNNDDMCALELSPSEAKLFKIQPVLTHLNDKFSNMYNLGQNISLDESLLMWKGWLDINQLVPNKTATMGIKTYEICESQTGYLWRFEIHAHKGSPPQQHEDPLNASTAATVLRLLHGLEHRGHTVWMDNFYNSPVLARRLKTLGFDCVGTLRTNRKFVPQALQSLTKENMRPGEIYGLTAGDVDVMVWRDNNRVGMISTYHGNAVSRDSRAGESTKPILISDYNIMMGGVDKKDQMLAMYPMERKRTQIWYKKLFRRLLNVSILNSYVIHKKSTTSPLSHRNFRTTLIKSILGNHCFYRPPVSATALDVPVQSMRTKKQKVRVVSADISHRLDEYPFSNHQRQRRRCTVCKKRTQTFCPGCSKTVCKNACFVALHT